MSDDLIDACAYAFKALTEYNNRAMKAFVFTRAIRSDGTTELVQHEYEDAWNLDALPAVNGSIIWVDGQWYEREQVGNGRRMHKSHNLMHVNDVPKDLRLRVLLLT